MLYPWCQLLETPAVSSSNGMMMHLNHLWPDMCNWTFLDLKAKYGQKEPLFCQSLEFWRWEGGLGFRYSKRFPLNLPVSVTVTFSDGALWGKPTSVLTNFNFRLLEWGLQNTGNQNSFFSRCLFSRCHKKTLDALNCNCLNNLTDKWDTVYWLSTLQVNTRLFSCVYKGDGLIKTISYRQPNEVWTIREKPLLPSDGYQRLLRHLQPYRRRQEGRRYTNPVLSLTPASLITLHLSHYCSGPWTVPFY